MNSAFEKRKCSSSRGGEGPSRLPVLEGGLHGARKGDPEGLWITSGLELLTGLGLEELSLC